MWCQRPLHIELDLTDRDETCPPGPNGLPKLLRRPLHPADRRCLPPDDRVSAAGATHPKGSCAQERTEDHRNSYGIPPLLSFFTVCKV